MTGFLVSFGIVIVGGGLGFYLDISGFVKEPSHFWFMGLITGLIAMFVGNFL
jgi:hypothetical protein